MLRKCALFALALSLMPAFAQAEQKRGDWAITLGGTGANNEDFDAGSFNINAQAGYFVTKELEVGIRQSVGYNDFNAGTAWNGSTRVFLDYHFDLGKFQPFVGLNLGYAYGDTTADTWAAGPEVGLKYYVHDKVFLYAIAEYQFFFDDADGIDEGFEEGSFVYGLGVGFLLP